MLAFIFPGQASQFIGMGKDLFEKFELAKEYYQKADEITGLALTDISFNGPLEELKQTKITQPAIFVHSVILAKLLGEKGIFPKMAAGHSLGEYSALVTAEVLCFEDALKIVALRGKLMQEAGEKQKGTMAAVIGLASDKIQAVCYEASEAGIVQAANFNSPGQIVISGSVKGVHKAMELAKAAGAKIVQELVVSGAFHSPLMKPAEEELSEELKKVSFKNAKIPIFANVTAKPATDADEIRELLIKQLTNPVLWEDLNREMILKGASRFLEVGPGNILKGLLKRIDRSAVCETVGKIEEYENLEL